MPVREIENEQNTGISDVNVMYKYLGIWTASISS